MSSSSPKSHLSHAEDNVSSPSQQTSVPPEASNNPFKSPQELLSALEQLTPDEFTRIVAQVHKNRKTKQGEHKTSSTPAASSSTSKPLRWTDRPSCMYCSTPALYRYYFRSDLDGTLVLVTQFCEVHYSYVEAHISLSPDVDLTGQRAASLHSCKPACDICDRQDVPLIGLERDTWSPKFEKIPHNGRFCHKHIWELIERFRGWQPTMVDFTIPVSHDSS